MTCEQQGCTNEATHTDEIPTLRGFMYFCDDCAPEGAIALDGPQWYGERLTQASELA